MLTETVARPFVGRQLAPRATPLRSTSIAHHADNDRFRSWREDSLIPSLHCALVAPRLISIVLGVRGSQCVLRLCAIRS